MVCDLVISDYPNPAGGGSWYPSRSVYEVSALFVGGGDVSDGAPRCVAFAVDRTSHAGCCENLVDWPESQHRQSVNELPALRAAHGDTILSVKFSEFRSYSSP